MTSKIINSLFLLNLVFTIPSFSVACKPSDEQFVRLVDLSNYKKDISNLFNVGDTKKNTESLVEDFLNKKFLKNSIERTTLTIDQESYEFSHDPNLGNYVTPGEYEISFYGENLENGFWEEKIKSTTLDIIVGKIDISKINDFDFSNTFLGRGKNDYMTIDNSYNTVESFWFSKYNGNGFMGTFSDYLQRNELTLFKWKFSNSDNLVVLGEKINLSVESLNPIFIGKKEIIITNQ